jgi:hypothetical protein
MKRSAGNNEDESRLQKARLGDVGLTGDKMDESDSSSTSSEDKKPKPSPKEVDMPYKKCKNFAERLMRVLHFGIGKDTIWWIGEGKAIAIHTRNLKKGNMLSDHFKVKDYSVFIRNCNRWGFRRTVQFPVPQGVISYQCSLFQEDEPHLVHHMRMDSDVQDVFVKHRGSEGNTPFDPKKIAKAARAAGGGQHDPRFAPAANSCTSVALNQHAAAVQGFSKEQVLQLIQGTNLAGAAQTLTRDPPGMGGAAPPPSYESTLMQYESTLMQQLLGTANKSAPRPPPVPQQEPRHDQLLQRILNLSEEYLTEPSQSLGGESTQPIRMALHILKLQGDKYHAEKKLELAQMDQLAALLAAAPQPAPPSTQPSMAGRVALAEQLFQSVNLAALAPPAPRPHEMVSAPVVVASSGQDQSTQSQGALCSSEALMQLLASNGIAPISQPLQQQPQQPVASVPGNLNLADLLGLLQNPQNNSR